MIDTKYASLERAGSRGRVVVRPPDREPMSSEESLRMMLGEWARNSVCQNVFLPYLDQLIAKAEAEEEMHVESHPRMVEGMAKRKALRALRAQFVNWGGYAD